MSTTRKKKPVRQELTTAAFATELTQAITDYKDEHKRINDKRQANINDLERIIANARTVPFTTPLQLALAIEGYLLGQDFHTGLANGSKLRTNLNGVIGRYYPSLVSVKNREKFLGATASHLAEEIRVVRVELDSLKATPRTTADENPAKLREDLATALTNLTAAVEQNKKLAEDYQKRFEEGNKRAAQQGEAFKQQLEQHQKHGAALAKEKQELLSQVAVLKQQLAAVPKPEQPQIAVPVPRAEQEEIVVSTNNTGSSTAAAPVTPASAPATISQQATSTTTSEVAPPSNNPAGSQTPPPVTSYATVAGAASFATNQSTMYGKGKKGKTPASPAATTNTADSSTSPRPGQTGTHS